MRASLVVAATLVAGCGLELSGLGAADDDGRVDGGGTAGEPDAAATGAVDGAPVSSDDAAMPDAASPPETGADDAASATGPDATSDAGSDAATGLDAGHDAAVTAGDALQFSGGSYVDMGALPIPADFTVEAWVKPSSTTGETDIVAEDRNAQAAGQFRLGITAGKLFFMMSDSGGNTYGLYAGSAYSLETTQALTVGSWSHVAVTKGGAAFALFVGATQAATFTATGSFAYGGPAVPFRVAARVGMNGSSADGAFAGVVDEVRLWNVARSASEIAGSVATTVSPADTTLLGYWRFDDGSGTTASDQKGAHPGTLVAGPVWVVSTAF